MIDTDWRPSKCPACGVMRKAAEYPVCENKECKYYAYRGDIGERMMKTETKNTRPGQYLWIRPNSLTSSPLVLVDDPVELFRGNQFDESVDKLYQIGNEVKFKVSLEPVQNYRLGDAKMKTVRAVSGSSDDLDDPDGVGNYRG